MLSKKKMFARRKNKIKMCYFFCKIKILEYNEKNDLFINIIFMKIKFTKKELFYLWLLTLAVVTPWLPWFYNLDLHLKFKYVIIPWICLILALLAIIWLIDNERNKEKNEYENNTKTDTFQKVSIDDKIWLIHRLRSLSPCSFEHLIEKIFQLKWYEIVQWPSYLWDKSQVDNWCDLIVKIKNENIYVQIKKNIANVIKEKQLKEFKWTILNNKWIYITTSLYSKNAKWYAKNQWITLIDYNSLWNEISSLKNDKKAQIEKFINEKDNIWDPKYKIKTCKKCGAPMKKWNWWYYCLNRYESMKCCNKEYIS